MELPSPEELQVPVLGPAEYPSPVESRGLPFVEESDRVLIPVSLEQLSACPPDRVPSFERAGPRRRIYFNPESLTCGIVTCGGLCPGLNDVIRSIVMTLYFVYGVKRIVGFRYGYAGLSASAPEPPLLLSPQNVERIHELGGTILGSSRGPQNVREMVDTLVGWNVGILFAIGGDGTMRGAHALVEEIARRNLKIAVIGVPKTIDNDLLWIERSFGFLTAVEAARPAIAAAHAEATGVRNGIGLVKLMGRESGFIAVAATLSNPDVNFCLIPEVPFTLRGEGGFLQVLEERLRRRGHAVIVVAEGAGQDLIQGSEPPQRDASGNVRLRDIGLFLKEQIERYFAEIQLPVNVKYIDPSYAIRSLPANSNDSAYCLILGQNAVHAGMAGRTDMLVGYWNRCFTHVPIPLAVRARKQVDPAGEEWKYVLLTTGQPARMVGRLDRQRPVT